MSEGKSGERVERRTVGNWGRGSSYTECDRDGGEESLDGVGNHVVGVVGSVVSGVSWLVECERR